MADVCLIAVVHGEVYERYARQLYDSAKEHLKLDAQIVTLAATPGWPAATLYRYHAILNWHCRCDYIFLCDADMRFEEPVGEEILGEIVATQHPGYVSGYPDLPYERRPESAAYVPEGQGKIYYAGGFVGGERESFLKLAAQIVTQIDQDDKNGVLAAWHDESHLNRMLSIIPPTLMLSPAYCHPDDDSEYLDSWPRPPYARKLVALDKSPKERGKR